MTITRLIWTALMAVALVAWACTGATYTDGTAPRIENATDPHASSPTVPTEEPAGPKDQNGAAASEATKLEHTAVGFDPMAEHHRAIFEASLEDPLAERLFAVEKEQEGTHFVHSDEDHLDKFYSSVKDLGGGYLGIGTDQGYLFAGWMQANLVWLIDYDEWVVLLHEVYSSFFKAADDRKEFLKLWNPKRSRRARALLKKDFKNDDRRARILKIYERSQTRIWRRLKSLSRDLKRKKIPGFITNDDQYEFVRSLIVNGRVRSMSGNLFGTTAIRGISDSARKLGVPIRAFYLSNAEQYWDYPQPFRENVYGLFVDDDSIILRTSASYPRNGDYCYGVQPIQNFQDWLKEPYIRRVKDMWNRGRPRSESDFPFTVLNEPPRKPKPRKRRSRRKAG